jgi:retron-type reverse transcriptase
MSPNEIHVHSRLFTAISLDRRVQLDKPDGGKRLLGIPVVVDRLIQQAILQRLEPLFDPTFSNSSYVFRLGRSAHMALEQARKYVCQEGRKIVVDLDLERFFDRVNHDGFGVSSAGISNNANAVSR